jgi:hypothetical protein
MKNLLGLGSLWDNNMFMFALIIYYQNLIILERLNLNLEL